MKKLLLIIFCLFFVSSPLSAEENLLTPKDLLTGVQNHALIDKINYFPVYIINVVDGDTFDGILYQGSESFKFLRFRVVDIDTPETWRPVNEVERIHGKAATKKAKELLLGKYVIVQNKFGNGVYGRSLVKVYLQNGDNYAHVMIKDGFSKRENY